MHMKKVAGVVGFVLVGAIAVNFIATRSNAEKNTSQERTDAFVQCLKDKGVQWKFAGSRQEYVIRIANVVARTGCARP